RFLRTTCCSSWASRWPCCASWRRWPASSLRFSTGSTVPCTTGWQACASADWTNVRAVIASFFITLLTIVFLFSLTGFQVTSEPAATRLLGRIGASLIEIDRWFPAHQEELQLRAEDRP